MHNVTDGNPFHTLGLPDSLGSFEQVFRARLWRDINEVRQKIAKTNGKTPQWLLTPRRSGVIPRYISCDRS